MLDSAFSSALIAWYKQNKRDLPWRNTRDPYAIWLSEVILQQTRVAQGLPYYEKFLAQYPDVHSLAKAPEEEVLRLWQGLGYYSRARNMHATAKQIAVLERFPENYSALLQQKGIGPYTASAIASFAYKEKVAVLDGNVYRVLSRFLGIDDDISLGKTQKWFREIAQSMIPEQESDVYNQAIMEFGALHCKPSAPLCIQCPVAELCVARKLGRQQQLPVKSKKTKPKDRFFNYFFLSSGSSCAVKKRGAKDIWQGLFDFFLVETTTPIEFCQNIPNLPKNLEQLLSQANLQPRLRSKHQLSHQTLFANFFVLDFPESRDLYAFAEEHCLSVVDKAELDALPKSVLVVKFLEQMPDLIVSHL